MVESKRHLFRVIVPVFPELNIYSYSKNAGSVVSLGAVMIATMANKLYGWRAEIIDENNYNGPRGKDAKPDHKVLQKESPADAVGFYCGLTSTIERVWELAKFYQDAGVKTLAGGWHASNCPEETLKHNIDLVVHGDGEPVIQKILVNIRIGQLLYSGVAGCSYISDGQAQLASFKNKAKNLDDLLLPDFGLLRFARIKVYPISRIRGCSMRCELCSVNRSAIWASPKHLFETVEWLVETRKAEEFFIVDDRLEEDLPGTIEFFKMIAEKYGNTLYFFVQTRLNIALKKEFLEVMKAAGVRTLFIGCESPIDEDLKNMNKGYTSKHMLEWVKILRRYFWVHGMFIFGYPPKDGVITMSAREMAGRFKSFISRAKFDSIQILKPIPLPGTGLRKRLEKEGRVFPLSLVPWSRYDGNSICFIPDNMSLKELNELSTKLMASFYSPMRSLWVVLRIFAFPFDYFIRGWTIGLRMGWIANWKKWHKKWFEKWQKPWYKDLVKCIGHSMIVKWERKNRESGIMKKLEKYCEEEDIF